MNGSPDNKDSKDWYFLGKAYLINDEYSKAIDAFKKSIEFDHKYIEALYSLAKSYGELERYNDALDSCEKCLEIDPNFKDAKKLKEKIIEKRKK